ncbi:hypothetical protein OAT16_00225 [Prolixibacteraceae bacterium]|nr:hypothetical protein [Prolixibacteraceae bacterium]
MIQEVTLVVRKCKIHRNMVSNYENLSICLQKDIDDCISRVQLSRILFSLDFNSFSSIHTSKQDSSE